MQIWTFIVQRSRKTSFDFLTFCHYMTICRPLCIHDPVWSFVPQKVQVHRPIIIFVCADGSWFHSGPQCTAHQLGGPLRALTSARRTLRFRATYVIPLQRTCKKEVCCPGYCGPNCICKRLGTSLKWSDYFVFCLQLYLQMPVFSKILTYRTADLSTFWLNSHLIAEGAKTQTMVL